MPRTAGLGPSTLARYAAREIEQHPLTKSLTEIFGGVSLGSTVKQAKDRRKDSHDRRVGWRTEIVSESLCDDVLKYIAPSLEAYKGCTIIDVHPGACLWSSKLHDLLKPKLHVLMEPEKRYLKTFIKPLLDAPGSRYRHSELTGAHPYRYMDNYYKLMGDGEAMPPRPPLNADDPKLRQLDTSILLTGNLARNYQEARGSKNVKYVPLILQHMANAALTNEIIHQSGLVQMLWWIPEEHKTNALPVALRSHRQLNHTLSLATKVVEVAGVESPELHGTPSWRGSPRNPRLTVSVSQDVKRSMSSRGLQVPPGREMPLGVEATDAELEHLEINPLDTTCTTIKDLAEAIENFSNHFTQWYDSMAEVRNLGSKALTKHLDDLVKNHLHYPQARYALTAQKISHIKMPRLRSIVLIDLTLRLMNLEANYNAVAELHPGAEEIPAFRDQILALDEKFAAACELFDSEPSKSARHFVIEDLHTFYCRPRTLARDNRDIEPLRASVEEFWPQQPLALLSMTPREIDIGVEGVANRKEGTKTGHELLVQLFQNVATPLPVQLGRVAFNAAQDLIPKVPAITDVRKGGRLNPMRMPVRQLTTEMTEGLVKAFLQWPFRPETWQLELLNTETGGGEEAEVAEEEVMA